MISTALFLSSEFFCTVISFYFAFMISFIYIVVMDQQGEINEKRIDEESMVTEKEEAMAVVQQVLEVELDLCWPSSRS